MNSELYKAHYLEEWERRASIEASVNTPITLLVVLGGALYFLASDFTYRHDKASVLFSILIAAASVSYLLVIRNLWKAVFGYIYLRIPTSNELGTYYQELLDYHESIGGEARDAHKDFEKYLNERYGEATERNASNNVSKLLFLHQLYRWVLAVFICMVLSLLPAGYRRVIDGGAFSASSTVEAQATTSTESNPMATQRPSPPAPDKPSSQQQPESKPLPPKPQGPPNHEVHEGHPPQKK